MRSPVSCTMIIDSDETGASIAKTLKAKSEQMRHERFARAEKEGAKASQKMLLPMICLILPAVMLTIFAPIGLPVFLWQGWRLICLSLFTKEPIKTLAQSVVKATHFTYRMRGLMGKKEFPISSAFWIIPCRRGVHTFFMHFSLDLIFVDRFLKITAIFQDIVPWRIIHPVGSFAFNPPAYSVFEFRSPALKPYHLQQGDQLHVGHLDFKTAS